MVQTRHAAGFADYQAGIDTVLFPGSQHRIAESIGPQFRGVGHVDPAIGTERARYTAVFKVSPPKYCCIVPKS